MKYELMGIGAYPAVKVMLDRGEKLTAESGAMVSMKTVDIETTSRGGIMGGLKQKLLGGESFFVNHFTSPNDGGEVVLAPILPGDIQVRELHGETVYLQSGASLGMVGNLDVDTKWKGWKNFFAGEGFFMLKISGNGTLFYNCFGAMYEVNISSGQTHVVDTGHIVMFDEGLSYAVRTFGGVKSFLFSGEGLVAEFTGSGKLMVQTRNIPGFVSWMAAHLPTKTS
ncbi:MAG: TIGR00266 family protein [Atribacterota bacterium]